MRKTRHKGREAMGIVGVGEPLGGRDGKHGVAHPDLEDKTVSTLS